MNKNYDLIIVGAGTAGCSCAIHAASKGLDVLILDRKKKDRIGDKVCGDLVGAELFSWIGRFLGKEYPKSGTVNSWTDIIKIYSPDRKSVFEIPAKGAMIDRHAFGQQLVSDAMASGCELKDNMRCKDAIIEDGVVCGVVAEDMSSGKDKEFRSRIVVDASGAISPFRNSIGEEGSTFDNSIRRCDESFSYREIRKLEKPIDYDDEIRIYISEKNAKGGYYWVFPESKDILNIGIGIPRHLETSELKKKLENIIDEDPVFRSSEIVHSGAGLVPTRRVLDDLVSDGFMCAGDAACQVIPISGGGIEQSFLGGYLCADVASGAIDDGDISKERLWELNVRYMDSSKDNNGIFSDGMLDGASLSSTDILRVFAQNLSDDELNFGMNNFMDKSVLADITMGRDSGISFGRKMKVVMKSATNLPLLLRFNNMLKLMHDMKALYRIYPSTPDGFQEWKRRIALIYSKVDKL